MNFWDRIAQTDVAGASARGFKAFEAGQEAAARGARNIEWSEQRPLRDALLQMQEEDAIVDMKLGRQVNNALNVIAESRPELYNSPMGYMNALNAISPLQEGQSRVLSEDGKNINIVGPDGQIMDSTPALKGKAAENALLDMSGLNLRQRTRTLPQEYQFEAQLNARLAENAMRQQWELEKIRAGLRGMGMGGGRGMSGVGGEGFGKFAKPSDWSSMMPWMAPAYLGAAGIPLTQNGTPDFSTMTPEQLQTYQQVMGQMLQDFSVGALQGMPALAAGINAYAMNTRREQAAAQAASNKAAQEEFLNKSAQIARRLQTRAQNQRQLEEFTKTNPIFRDPLGLGIK